jgi:hypothetical protein
MPELPDVEGFRRYLAKHAEGRRIVRVDVPDREIVRNRSPQALDERSRVRRFGGIWLASDRAECDRVTGPRRRAAVTYDPLGHGRPYAVQVAMRLVRPVTTSRPSSSKAGE